MGFAKEVADRVMLFDDGLMVEENTPKEFFDNPKNERTKLFLSQILRVCPKDYFQLNQLS